MAKSAETSVEMVRLHRECVKTNTGYKTRVFDPIHLLTYFLKS